MCSSENIRIAYMNARKGKLHYSDVQKIDSNTDYYVEKLRQMLSGGHFSTSNYQVIQKHTGSKVRIIHKLPFFPDRIVHHCIVQVVQKMWISSLIRDTYSTIPGRGIHDGVKRIKKAMNDTEGTRYCLKIDVKKYYPSIDPDILKSIVRKKIKDTKMLALIDNIIDSSEGIPIGNYLSQWFGNLYLNYFDHYCKQQLKCKYYYRYCDDVVILSESKEFLHGVLIAMNHYLESELHLSINENYQIFPVDSRGVDFLGYRFFHGYTLVRKRIVTKMKRRLANKNANARRKSAGSYYGWLKHANAYRLTTKYIQNERTIRQTA